MSQPRRPPPRAASAPRAACLRQHRLGPAVCSSPPPRAAPPRGPFRQTRSQSSNPPCRGPPAPTLRARQVPTTAPSRAKHTKPAGTPSQNPPQTRAGLVARLADKNWLGSVVGGPSSKMASSDGGDVGFRARWGGCAAAGRSQKEPQPARRSRSWLALGCVPRKMLVGAGPTVVEPLSAPAALQPWRRARTTPTTTRTTRRTGTASRSPRASGGSPPRGCAATGSRLLLLPEPGRSSQRAQAQCPRRSPQRDARWSSDACPPDRAAVTHQRRSAARRWTRSSCGTSVLPRGSRRRSGKRGRSTKNSARPPGRLAPSRTPPEP